MMKTNGVRGLAFLWMIFSLVLSLPALACQYCSSTSQVCDTYEQVCSSYSQQCVSYTQVCDSYTQVCNGYQTVCDGYQQVCDGYQDVCDSYEDVCDQYDDYGNCISSSTVCVSYTSECTGYSQQCTGYSQQCTGYTQECASYSDQCSAYQQVCDGYTQECTHYTTQCDSYYYGDYVTVSGTAYNTNTGLYLRGASASLSSSGGGTVSTNTDSNGAYSDTLFVYDDSNGYLDTTICAGLAASDTQCYSLQSYDSCSSPSLSQNFALNVTALVPPVNLNLVAASSTQLTVSWNSGGGLTNGYFLSVVPGNFATPCYNTTSGVNVGNTTSYTISNLSANTKYAVAVCSYDVNGNPSTQVSGTQTTQHTPPPAPLGVTELNVVTDQFMVNWTSGGGSTTGFYVAVAAGNTQPNCSAGTNVGNVTSYQVTGLQPHTTYTVAVCATDIYSDFSAPATSSQLTKSPPAPVPTGLNFSAISQTSATAKWLSGGGYTGGFIANLVPGNLPNLACSAGVDVGAVLSKAFTSLTPNTVYTLALCAYNYDGVQTASIIQTVTTLQVPPAAPTGLSLAVISSSQINASWANGGGTTTGFKVFSAVGTVAPACTASAGLDTQMTLSGALTSLQPNTKYTVAVCAYNINGIFSTAATASATTLDAPSPAPTSLVLNAISSSQINASWTSGGGSTKSFVVAFAQGTTAPSCASGINVGTATSYSLTGLLPTTTYAVSVCALNANSLASAALTGTQASLAYYLAINAGGPATGAFVADKDFSGGTVSSTTSAINLSKATNPAPAAVYQTNRYGNLTATIPGLVVGASYGVRLHFAEIYWTAANSRLFNVLINGTKVLSNYDIFAQAGGKNIAVTSSFTATANTSGNIVISFVTVKDNSLVSGIEILAQTVQVPNPAPSPTGLSFSGITSSGATASWTSGGGTTTGFKVAYVAGTTAPNCQTGTEVGANVSSALTGLSGSTTYTVSVCAHNSAMAYSAPITNSFVTLPAAPPAPVSLSFTALTTSGMTVNWTSGGGSTSSYEIAYAAGTTAPACSTGTKIGNVTSYQLTGLNQNTSYSVSICALNSNSVASSALSGTQATKSTAAFYLGVNVGGAAAGSFVADADVANGTVNSTTAAINVSKAANPAPAAVYQSNRYGNMTITVPKLVVGATYNVRLHFAETYWANAGARVFNAAINGTPVLTNFDILSSAGGKNIAITKLFTAKANASGAIVITFTTVKDNALINGFEIFQ